jgi:predicted metal-dependent hydrolase
MPESTFDRNLRLLTEEEVVERRHILLAGIEQFNSGYFFESHETLEELWLPCPWPIRPFLQGIIQLAAGFVHLKRREYPGTVKLLRRAIDKIEAGGKGYLGVDAPRLAKESRRALSELEALGEDRFEEWDHGRIPRIGFVTDS